MTKLHLTHFLWLSILALSVHASQANSASLAITSEKMLDAYEAYRNKNSNKAFAIAPTGQYGWSADYASASEAKTRAIDVCRGDNSKIDCQLFDYDGITSPPTLNRTQLRTTLRNAAQTVWPKTKPNTYPLELSDFRSAQKGYKEYVKKTGHKMFAISESGAWAYSSIQSADEVARHYALTNCEQHGKPCTIVDINNTAINGSIEIIPLPEFSKPSGEQLPIAIRKQSQLDSFKKYLTKKGHRAFVISTLGRAYWAAGRNSLEKAKKDALQRCEEGFFSICKLAAVDGVILGDTYEASLIKTAPSLDVVNLPKSFVQLGGVDLSTYLEKKGNKAYATNKFNAVGFASGMLLESQAKDVALKQCEAFNKTRAGKPQFKNKIAPCHIVLINHQLDTEALERVMAQ